MSYYVKIKNGQIVERIDSTSKINDKDLMEISEMEYKLISACDGNLWLAERSLNALKADIWNWNDLYEEDINKSNYESEYDEPLIGYTGDMED